MVQRLSRDQKTLDYLKVDPRTGKSSLLMSDKAENWINLHDDFKPLKDGSFLFSSERSGFNHLYRMADGRVTQLTDGPWVTGGLVGVDEQSGKLFFTANRGNPIEYQLHSLDYRTAGAQPQLLTRPGTNNGAVMDKTGKLALVSTSYPGQPQQVWLADGSGKRLAWIDENRVTGDHPYAPFAGLDAKPTYGKLLAADGRTQLDYRLIMPRLARGQRAPVLMTVYGGPQSQDVMNGYRLAARSISRPAGLGAVPGQQSRPGGAWHRIPEAGLSCARGRRGAGSACRPRMAEEAARRSGRQGCRLWA